MRNDRIKISKVIVVEDIERKISDALRRSRMPYKIISFSSCDASVIMSRLFAYSPDVVVIDTDSRNDHRDIAEMLLKTLFATHKRFLILAVGERSSECPADLFLARQSDKDLARHIEKAIRISKLLADDLAIDEPLLSKEKVKSSFDTALSRCLKTVKKRRRSFR